MVTAAVKTNKPSQAREYFHNKMEFTTGPVEVDHMLEQGLNVNIIDVRAAEDYRDGHVPGAVNIPQDQWDGDLERLGLQRDRQNIVYCYSVVCHLAARAAVKFADAGFPVMEMDGGFRSWREHDLRVER